jgi:hypothetical protein
MRRLYMDHAKTFTYKQKNRGIYYHHYYSPVPSGGPWATEGRICDTSKSEAGHAWI